MLHNDEIFSLCLSQSCPYREASTPVTERPFSQLRRLWNPGARSWQIGARWGLLSASNMAPWALWPHWAGKTEGINPPMSLEPSWPIQLLRVLPLNSTTLAIRFQLSYGFGGYSQTVAIRFFLIELVIVLCLDWVSSLSGWHITITTINSTNINLNSPFQSNFLASVFTKWHFIFICMCSISLPVL